ncbi:hypothetical protein CLOP_g2706 [Closterium sp. NIES-67]|nr:hypothetical protein CLOP_g2706 [Closterium sp. NIES-67]
MEFTLEKCRGDIHRVQDHAAPANEVQEHADDRGSGGRRGGYVDEGAVADKGLVLFEDCLAPMRVVGACHSFVIISRLEDDGRTGEDQYRSAGHAEGDCLGVGEEVEAKKFTMGMVIEEFTAAIGMEAANGTTEVGARLLGPGDDKGRCFGLRAKEGDRGVS